MTGPTLSRFTPSLMAADLLERLFVARDRTLDEIVRRIGAAESSAERNHTLLVGPRGAGKTHLVALAYHRTKARIAEGQRLQIAWLPEDPWTIVTYRHLLAEVVTRLEPPFDGEVPRTADELERILEVRATEHGPVVVIVENLDQILAAIEDDGQQRLRHLLQDERSLLLLATSTTLDRSLADQVSPFYAFFSTTRLEPFGVDEAAEMLTAIARERGDEALVDYLASDEGRARLRTIEHLAGGQPRMWAALASALTVEGLDDLVDLLLTRFDDLTPYYQEQLARLSGRQRLVVAELAEADRPLMVKDLAARLEVEQRSLAKTVSDLVERRWIAPIDSPVTALLDKRFTYYELAEPMARLSFQIKDTRGEPLRLVVDFLKHWFDPADLADVISDRVEDHVQFAVEAQSSDAVLGTTRILAGLPATSARVSSVLGAVDDALADIALQNGDAFLALPSSIRAAIDGRLGDGVARLRQTVHIAALMEAELSRPSQVDEWVGRAESLVASLDPGDVPHRDWVSLARWLLLAGRADAAIAVTSNFSSPEDDFFTMIEAWFVYVFASQTLMAEDRSGEVVVLARNWARQGWPGLIAPFDDLVGWVVADAHRKIGNHEAALNWTNGLYDEAIGTLPGILALVGAARVRALVAAGNRHEAIETQKRLVHDLSSSSPESKLLADERDRLERFERSSGPLV